MTMDIIARALAATADAKIGDVPQGKTIMDLINSIEVGDYDDTALIARIETLEEEDVSIHKDLEALKSLISEDKLNEMVAVAVDAQIEDAIANTVAPVALSGNINDLTQDEGDYVVLACGSSDELE